MNNGVLSAGNKSEEKKLCLIYANCQGGALGAFLQKSKAFLEQYQVELVHNFQAIQNGSEPPIDALRRADLFLYQPLDPKHGVYATDYLKKYLPLNCVMISFPYIYNDALWPLFEDSGNIYGKESIIALIDNGLSLKKIISIFCSGEIDFQFEKRFARSINILRSKESATDIKIVDFIVDNLKKEKLFLTHNHQTSSVYIHCVNQILHILCLPLLSLPGRIHPNEIAMTDCWPQSPYETDFYGLDYLSDWQECHPERKDSNWHRFYLRLIGKIYFSYPMPWIKRVWERTYLYLRIKWGLLIGAGYLRPVDRKKIKGWRNGTRQKI